MEDVGQRRAHGALRVAQHAGRRRGCASASILLDRGGVAKDGPAAQVVSAYLTQGLGTTGSREFEKPSCTRSAEVAGLRAVRLRDEHGKITDVLDIRRAIDVEMEYDVWKPGYVLTPYFSLSGQRGRNHRFSELRSRTPNGAA